MLYITTGTDHVYVATEVFLYPNLKSYSDLDKDKYKPARLWLGIHVLKDPFLLQCEQDPSSTFRRIDESKETQSCVSAVDNSKHKRRCL